MSTVIQYEGDQDAELCDRGADHQDGKAHDEWLRHLRNDTRLILFRAALRSADRRQRAGSRLTATRHSGRSATKKAVIRAVRSEELD